MGTQMQDLATYCFGGCQQGVHSRIGTTVSAADCTTVQSPARKNVSAMTPQKALRGTAGRCYGQYWMGLSSAQIDNSLPTRTRRNFEYGKPCWMTCIILSAIAYHPAATRALFMAKSGKAERKQRIVEDDLDSTQSDEPRNADLVQRRGGGLTGPSEPNNRFRFDPTLILS